MRDNTVCRMVFGLTKTSLNTCHEIFSQNVTELSNELRNYRPIRINSTYFHLTSAGLLDGDELNFKLEVGIRGDGTTRGALGSVSVVGSDLEDGLLTDGHLRDTFDKKTSKLKR